MICIPAAAEPSHPVITEQTWFSFRPRGEEAKWRAERRVQLSSNGGRKGNAERRTEQSKRSIVWTNMPFEPLAFIIHPSTSLSVPPTVVFQRQTCREAVVVLFFQAPGTGKGHWAEFFMSEFSRYFPLKRASADRFKFICATENTNWHSKTLPYLNPSVNSLHWEYLLFSLKSNSGETFCYS